MMSGSAAAIFGRRLAVACRRQYTSRAHSKPTPEFSVVNALEHVLTEAQERVVRRQEKWDGKADEREKQGIKADGPYRNQDETIEFIMNLNLDPRKPGQALRGSIPLPHGTGKSVKVAIFTSDLENAKQLLERGASLVGGEDLVEQIVRGDVPIDFDRALASRDIIPLLSKKLARTLGPRGLLPNPKVGTVVDSATDLMDALDRQLAGELQYRTDREGIIHTAVGKASFGSEKLIENIRAVVDGLYDVKPEAYGKGKKPSKNARYVLRAHVTAQQGKSFRIKLPTIDPSSNYFFKKI